MAEKQEKLYQTAMRKGAIQRYGSKLIMVVMYGEGAVLVPTMDWQAVSKWAMTKNGTGSPMKDRMTLFERLECVVARPGSFMTTKGNSKLLENVVKGMGECGLDPKEWVLPPDLKEMLDKKPGDDDKDKKKDKKDAAAADEADVSGVAATAAAPAAPAAEAPPASGTWFREKDGGN